MKNSLITFGGFFIILGIGIIVGVFLRHNQSTWFYIKKPFIDFYYTPKEKWGKGFSLVNIESSIDNKFQKAYSYNSKSNTPQPLIVSLHTWGGNYNQYDELSQFCKKKDINYIHPDFRGTNNSKNACCSSLALTDIDDAITYAITNFNVDKSKIYVIGVSGGGFATLSTFMKSKHHIKKFSAWASVTDLIARYNQSEIMKDGVSDDIFICTNSVNQLHIENAKQKSPIYWKTPIEKLKESKVSIYAGVFDGIQGSVPITHSINFYNKVLVDLSVSDSSKYVTTSEKLKLLEFRKPLGNYGYVGDRKIYLKKEFGNLSLIIFKGNHEMLTEFAFNELIND